ncbi:Zinc finger, CCHC-type [Trema orientale]|uniref:Zinc finger, CCHC-type n=1 Tax=Trema orientale TaxID=63057 RepID=A0A2P5FYY9_TREOI|nr:Zinc finger, CCHC-type [Trema orientale]
MISDRSGLESLSAEIGAGAFSKRRKRKRRTKKKKKQYQLVIEDLDQVTVNLVNEQNQVDISQHREMAVMETESHVTKNNSVLRKLLRRARYFDPPEESSCTCRNCGEEGHREQKCPAQKRRRPCFVCGTYEHSWRRCRLRRNCFLCKGRGHLARHCPNKDQEDNPSPIICLRCGDSGHDMFSCCNDYCFDDIKEIQCYICKSFGHLCCVDSPHANPVTDSCYNCGQSGHLGSGCMKTRKDIRGFSLHLCTTDVERQVILPENPKLCAAREGEE